MLFATREWNRFDYLVPSIDDAIAAPRLSSDMPTHRGLLELGETMPSNARVMSNIPAPYTYLGQFIDHDITFTMPVGKFDPDARLNDVPVTPIDAPLVSGLLRNGRTSAFDLDSLYGLEPRESPELAVPYRGDRFVLGHVSPLKPDVPGKRPHGKGDDNDLPRVAMGGRRARMARIGDPRNDENTVVAQLHLAFMKFHNAVVDCGHDFDAARRLVVQHYQWLVLTDFLPRICDPAIVQDVLQRGNRLYEPRDGQKYMPLEFALAAYRIGHSMVRSSYNFNVNFNDAEGAVARATLPLLFQFTGSQGSMGNHDTLPESWIAEWERLFTDRAMALDPSVTPFLQDLPGQDAVPLMKKLATRNLLRGFLFSLPTGQALAEVALQQGAMSEQQVLDGCSSEPSSSGDFSQRDVVGKLGFHKSTPLWLYILAEAKTLGGGNHLGPLGSLIVVETIVGLLRESHYSILRSPFVPTLGARPGRFDLQDLLTKAGVLSHRVQ